jgi:hypothetical protein
LAIYIRHFLPVLSLSLSPHWYVFFLTLSSL